MKKNIRRLSMLLASVMIMSMLIMNVFAAPIFPFTDVKTDAWYYKDVKNAYEKKLINGKTESTYGPDENMTYAEAVKLAACMHQLKKEGSIKLKNGNPWYQSYVDYAKKHKLITSDLAWNTKATRGGYMEIFANVLTDAESKKNNVPDGSIPDVGLAHQNATAIYKLYRAGIVTGVDAKHNCDPDASIRRSEVAAILTRMTDKSKRVAFSMSSSSTADSGGSGSSGSGGSGSGSGGSGSGGSGSGGSGSGGSGSGGSGGGSGSGLGLGISSTKPDLRSDLINPGSGSSELKIKKHPQNTEAASGDTIALTVEAQGGKQPYSYQWQILDVAKGEFVDLTGEDYEQGEGIKGKRTNKLEVWVDEQAGAVGDHTLRCVVKDADGNSVTSNAAFVKYTEIKIARNPENARKVKPTDIAKFSVEAESGKKPYTYSWEIKTEDSWTWVKNIPQPDLDKYFEGWTTDTLSVTAAGNEWVKDREFRCQVTDANSNYVYSNWAKLTVDELRITAQPAKKIIPMGQYASLSVGVEGGKGQYTYQWIVFRPEVNHFAPITAADGAEGLGTNEIRFKVERNAYLVGKNIRCKIKDETGTELISEIGNIGSIY